MTWQKVCVDVGIGYTVGSVALTYYSELLVEVNDIVVVETRNGPVRGRVIAIIDTVHVDPFDKDNGYHAKKHVLENATKKIYKETMIMLGSKTVEVRHIGSNRTGVFYTDIDLKEGDTVVYESDNSNASGTSLHVGIVTNADPDVMTAKYHIVDVVDMSAHKARKERIKKASKIRAQLDAKRKQYQDLELLKLIAASDPETKTLLDEYTSLVSNK